MHTSIHLLICLVLCFRLKRGNHHVELKLPRYYAYLPSYCMHLLVHTPTCICRYIRMYMYMYIKVSHINEWESSDLRQLPGTHIVFGVCCCVGSTCILFCIKLTVLRRLSI